MKDVVSSVAITPDSSWVLSSSRDKSIRILDAASGALQCIIMGHQEEGDYFPSIPQQSIIN